MSPIESRFIYMLKPGLSISVVSLRFPFSANARREGVRLSVDIMAKPLLSAKLNTYTSKSDFSERESGLRERV